MLTLCDMIKHLSSRYCLDRYKAARIALHHLTGTRFSSLEAFDRWLEEDSDKAQDVRSEIYYNSMV